MNTSFWSETDCLEIQWGWEYAKELALSVDLQYRSVTFKFWFLSFGSEASCWSAGLKQTLWPAALNPAVNFCSMSFTSLCPHVSCHCQLSNPGSAPWKRHDKQWELSPKYATINTTISALEIKRGIQNKCFQIKKRRQLGLFECWKRKQQKMMSWFLVPRVKLKPTIPMIFLQLSCHQLKIQAFNRIHCLLLYLQYDSTKSTSLILNKQLRAGSPHRSDRVLAWTNTRPLLTKVGERFQK